MDAKCNPIVQIIFYHLYKRLQSSKILHTLMFANGTFGFGEGKYAQRNILYALDGLLRDAKARKAYAL